MDSAVAVTPQRVTRCPDGISLLMATRDAVPIERAVRLAAQVSVAITAVQHKA